MAVTLSGSGIIGRDTQQNIKLNGDGSVVFEEPLPTQFYHSPTPIDASQPFNGISPDARMISVSLFDVAHPSTAFCIHLGFDGGFLNNNYNCVSTFFADGLGSGSGQFYQGIAFYGFYQFPLAGNVRFEKFEASTVWAASGLVTCHTKVANVVTAGRALMGAITKPTNNYSIRVVGVDGSTQCTGQYSVIWGL